MSRTSRHLVTVVMPTYNEEEFVEDAIVSVLRQSYDPVELIVVDDGSTDATIERATSYERQLRLLTTPQEGASHARNMGASAANGEFLLFCDADDCLGLSAIEGLAEEQMSVDSQRAISVCDWAYLMLDESCEWVKKSPSGSSFEPEKEDALGAWISGRFYPSCAVMWSRRLFDEIGGWDESLTANQDGDLVIRGLLSGGRIAKSDAGRSYYRQHDDGQRISDRRNKEAFRSRWKVLRRVETRLQDDGRLDTYRVELGQAYHSLAKNLYRVDRDIAIKCERRAREVAGPRSVVGSQLHRFLYETVGLVGKERLRTLFGGWVR